LAAVIDLGPGAGTAVKSKGVSHESHFLFEGASFQEEVSVVDGRDLTGKGSVAGEGCRQADFNPFLTIAGQGENDFLAARPAARAVFNLIEYGS
jgi:hypothetical protein